MNWPIRIARRKYIKRKQEVTLEYKSSKKMSISRQAELLFSVFIVFKRGFFN